MSEKKRIYQADVTAIPGLKGKPRPPQTATAGERRSQARPDNAAGSRPLDRALVVRLIEWLEQE